MSIFSILTFSGIENNENKQNDEKYNEKNLAKQNHDWNIRLNNQRSKSSKSMI